MTSPKPKSVTPLWKRLSIWSLELLLIAIIIGLLVATWLPAIIGANPDAARTP
jgi:hypothetical protein